MSALNYNSALTAARKKNHFQAQNKTKLRMAETVYKAYIRNLVTMLLGRKFHIFMACFVEKWLSWVEEV